MQVPKDLHIQLSNLKKELQGKYPIATLALFGSYSRGEQTQESDIDLLVEFNERIGSDFILLAEEIEQKLGKKVDLVSKKGLKEKYFNQIKEELIYV